MLVYTLSACAVQKNPMTYRFGTVSRDFVPWWWCMEYGFDLRYTRSIVRRNKYIQENWILTVPKYTAKLLITCNIIAMAMHTIQDMFTVVIPLTWFINKLCCML